MRSEIARLVPSRSRIGAVTLRNMKRDRISDTANSAISRVLARRPYSGRRSVRVGRSYWSESQPRVSPSLELTDWVSVRVDDEKLAPSSGRRVNGSAPLPART